MTGSGLAPAPVTLLDVSLQGVSVRCEVPLTPGDDLLLSPSDAGTLLLVYKIKSCEALSSGYRLGAEYVGSMGGAEKLDADAACEALATVSVCV